jgi:phosphoserine phosphatase RsbU/P
LHKRKLIYAKEDMPMRILISEDDLTSRTLLTGVLKKCGYEVVETETGTAAWNALQQFDAPRLAILDWMLPLMDGLEVVRRVRSLATEWQPYIIMLTTRGDKGDIIHGLEAGANDYLAKPFDAGELRARVEVGCRMITMQDALACKIEELRQALDQIKTLRGILPICASCKKIRDDQGYWNQVEVYVREHTEAEFSHGICPECVRKLYPEWAESVLNNNHEG